MINVSVTKITDHPDGTATLEMEMDEYTLYFLAKIGVMTLIENAAKETLDGYPDPEGDGDADARARRDSELFGEIPEL